MISLTAFRRTLLLVMTTLTVGSMSMSPALGAGAQIARKHKTTHHKSTHKVKKKSSCSGDRDGDGNEPRVNDGDGCNI